MNRPVPPVTHLDQAEKKEEGKREPGPELLRGLSRVLLPFLLTAGGLLGFVAVAGGAVVWTRFSAAEVPPDQVVAIYPRTELVAIASALLVLFGLVGLIAFALCYLIDPKGRASIGMTRVLLTVTMIEGLAVILFITEPTSWQQRYLAALIFILALLACFCVTALYERPEIRYDEKHLQEQRKRFFFVAGSAAVVIAVLSLLAMHSYYHGSEAKVGIAALLACWLPVVWLAWTLRNGRPKESQRKLERFEVPYTRNGMAAIIAFMILAVAAPTWVMKSWWLGVSLFVAAILFAALWRAALMPKDSFIWYGIAVFISVPLFGTFTWMAQNTFEPQVQPVAMIRKTGGVDEYLQGLYVTETSDQVYFATVATKGCRKDVVPGSGRLLSVPKSEIAAMTIGPLQSVDNARRAALEMTYMLAPTAGVRAGPIDDRGSNAPREGRRLESVPGAIEPRFGKGMRIVPEVAAPGEKVTLRMSAPSEDTRGFGRSRHHRTLRVDGIPAAIAKERAHSPWEAEYVKTKKGKSLKVGKQIAYTKEEGSYTAVSRHDDFDRKSLFLRLSDKSVVALWIYSPKDHEYVETNNTYLPLRWKKGQAVELKGGEELSPKEEEERLPMVTLRNQKPGKKVLLRPRLVRQNWHEDHIEFHLPRGARSGRVTIDCEQVANEPYLQVRDNGSDGTRTRDLRRDRPAL